MNDDSISDQSPAAAYETYMVPGMFAPFVKDLLADAAPQTGECVLDLACGTGIVARHLASHVVPHGSVDALDLNHDMLTVARETARRAGVSCIFHHGRMEQLPFASATYDLVTCQQGLQFVSDRAAAVGEMHRVLRPNGRAVVSCWSSIEHHPLSRIVADVMERSGGGTQMQQAFALGRAEQLRGLFETAGFLTVDLRTVTRPVRFPAPDRYLTMAVSGVLASNPDLQQLTDAERNRLLASVRAKVEPQLRQFVIDDRVVSTKQTHIVRAYT